MPRPVCVKCQIQMRMEIMGVGLLELATPNRPYKIWSSDLFRCPVCGHEILSGYAGQATHHSDENFMKQVEYCKSYTRLVLDHEKVQDAIIGYEPDFSNLA